jgi:hypothetical protein
LYFVTRKLSSVFVRFVPLHQSYSGGALHRREGVPVTTSSGLDLVMVNFKVHHFGTSAFREPVWWETDVALWWGATLGSALVTSGWPSIPGQGCALETSPVTVLCS